MSPRPREFDVTLVTHLARPAGAPDDQLLASALQQQGLAVRMAAWNDPCVDWRASPLTVVRSAWDYHHAPQAWAQWLHVVSGQTQLANAPALLAWNTDKRYLRDLQAAGVTCIPTWFVDHGAAAVHPPGDFAEWIVKPAIGASARGVRRFAADVFASQGMAYAHALAADGAALLQPYLKDVETALERSLVFIAGAFSHAFTKPAFSTDAAGGTVVQRHTPSGAELALAKAALAALCAHTLYARVDLVLTEDGPLLMELELIEPDLALRMRPSAALALARACLDLLAIATDLQDPPVPLTPA